MDWPSVLSVAFPVVGTAFAAFLRHRVVMQRLTEQWSDRLLTRLQGELDRVSGELAELRSFHHQDQTRLNDKIAELTRQLGSANGKIAELEAQGRIDAEKIADLKARVVGLQVERDEALARLGHA